MKRFLTTTTAMILISAPAFAAEPLIGPEELQGLLGDANIVVLDVRSTLESSNEAYGEGHIPGAINANYTKSGWRGMTDGVNHMLPETSIIEAMIQGLGVDSDDHVVIYSAGVSPRGLDFAASTRAYWTFKVLGHENVSILDGGFHAWAEAGNAVSTDGTTPEMGNFSATLNADLVADGDMVLAAVENEVELIDARPSAHFLADKQPGYARTPGTIPSSVNMPAPGVVGEGGMGLKPLESYSAQLDKIGVTEGEKAYVFCNTGHYCTSVWFIGSELLDRDFAVYDGSIYEWTQIRKEATVIGKNPE